MSYFGHDCCEAKRSEGYQCFTNPVFFLIAGEFCIIQLQASGLGRQRGTRSELSRLANSKSPVWTSCVVRVNSETAIRQSESGQLQSQELWRYVPAEMAKNRWLPGHPEPLVPTIEAYQRQHTQFYSKQHAVQVSK